MGVRHSHEFNDSNPLAEQRTRLVVLLTVIMMVVEITAGWLFKSMALLADGWHMSSHAIALGLSAAAYTMARRLKQDERFAFGTWTSSAATPARSSWSGSCSTWPGSRSRD
jgi:Co/Zn/Cd efflux system component